ncbi:sugar ABC transporter permease [Halobacteria archaeon AArc-m2/3/4]|uniref:Sugar ABC transporter permease n=1 Tax=Natronoglomus mannanivorans TaxID=2979990 RepID=A0AAP3E2D9_9EURY|nr:sugar ABC transporter permease [Halobacteria archaeon AArc-xg1-1]MCU4973423.1 sugar ABC transporter permease [Halobacteria archaeon AArc-m2/3/4]
MLDLIAAMRTEGPRQALNLWWQEMVDEYDRRESAEGILFALPYLIAFVGFMLFPLLYGFYMSLYDWDALNPEQSEFIGLGNYQTLVNDPRFWEALWNTVWFVILTVPPLVILALLLALGVNRNVKGQTLLRTIFFSPYILTVAVVSLIWVELFAGEGGFIRYWLGFVMEDPPRFLIDPTWAMVSIAVATVWWSIAFNFIILLAARQNVPDRLYEAAKLDGASSYRMMRDITIPQMRNPLIFVVIITFVGSFQVFGQPYIMTDGGPRFSTHTIVMYLYTTGFAGRDFGYAAAIGYVLFLILITVSVVNYYVLSENE